MRKLLFSATCLFIILLSNSCEVCDLDLGDDTAPDINILVQIGDEAAYTLEDDILETSDFASTITFTMFGVDSQSGIHVLNSEITGTAFCLSGPQDVEGVEDIMNEYPLDDNGCSISSRNISYEIPGITSCPNPSPLEAILEKMEWEFIITSINHAGLQSQRVVNVIRE